MLHVYISKQCCKFNFIFVVATVSFEVVDGIILEGDPDDNAQISLEVVSELALDRNVTGMIEISDIGSAGVDGT